MNRVLRWTAVHDRPEVMDPLAAMRGTIPPEAKQPQSASEGSPTR